MNLLKEKEITLLSPAKNLKCAVSAFEFGADAIYFGIGKFNARAQGENFNFEDLRKLLSYKLEKNKKIYLTLNTLIKNIEIDTILEFLENIKQFPIDGIIVQDLGLAKIIKEFYPQFELHASTQMAVTNLDGALFLEDLGFKQVVLARELSLKEIEKIKSKTSLKLEVFIHGAMCYSVSGMCLASSILGGSSGNRGLCSQVCRMKFYFEGEKKKFWGYPFNMKDLWTIDILKDILPLVDTLKIEGRLKDEYYVAVNTYIYRKIIDSILKNNPIKEDELEYLRQLSKCVFSREKWLGYYKNPSPKDNINPNYPGNIGLFIGKIRDLFLKRKKGHIKIFLRKDLKIPIYPYDTFQIFFKTQKDKNVLIQIKKVKVKSNILEARVINSSLENLDIKDIDNKVYLINSGYVKKKFSIKLPNIKPHKEKYKIKLFIDEDRNEIKLKWKNFIFKKNLNLEKPQKFITTKNDIKEIFEKSPYPFSFKVENISYNEKYFIPKSILSKLKKEFYEKFYKLLEKEKENNIKNIKQNIFNEEYKKIANAFNINRIIVFSYLNFKSILNLIEEKYFRKTDLLVYKIISLKHLKEDIENLKRIKNIQKIYPNIKFGFSLPLAIFENERPIFESFIKENRSFIPNILLINHFWEIKLFEKYFENYFVYLDSFCYILNKSTYNLYKEYLKSKFLNFVYSYEDDMENILKFPFGFLTIYSDIPLFISRTCIKRVFDSCNLKAKKESIVCKDIFLKKKHLKKEIYETFTGRMFDCKFYLFWKIPLNLNSIKPFLKDKGLLKEKYEFIYFKFSEDKIKNILEGKNALGHRANLERGLK